MGKKKKLTIKGETVDFAIKSGLARIGLTQDRVITRILQKEYHGIFKHKGAIISLIYDEEESEQEKLKIFKASLTEEFKIKYEGKAIFLQVSRSFYDQTRLPSEAEREEFLASYLKEQSILDPDEEGFKQIVWNPEAQHTFVKVKDIPLEPMGNTGSHIHLQLSEDKLLCQAIIFQPTEEDKEKQYETFLAELNKEYEENKKQEEERMPPAETEDKPEQEDLTPQEEDPEDSSASSTEDTPLEENQNEKSKEDGEIDGEKQAEEEEKQRIKEIEEKKKLEQERKKKLEEEKKAQEDARLAKEARALEERENKAKQMVEEMYVIGLEDILAILKKHRCVKGVLKRNILKAIKEQPEGYFEVARGKLPVDDQAPSLELYFRNKQSSQSATRTMEAMTVDVRNVKDISVAERNQLLIRIGEVIEGENGFTVQGEVLEKKSLEEVCPIKLGEGVYLADNNREVYAKSEGHIVWRPEEFFLDVEAIYLVEGNVDFSQGNINGFVGKVIINGDVKPKFSVSAEGDIEIHGDVEDSYIESTAGNVTVHGTVVHQNEGYVKAAETFNGSIASNAKIFAKDIIMEKQVFNSELRAKNEIKVLGTPGVIVGGETHASHAVYANIIGSDSWVATEVHIGDVTEIKNKVRMLSQRINETEELIKETKRIISMLKTLQSSHELTEMQTQQLSDSVERLKALKKDLDRDMAERVRLKEEIENCKKAKLEVQNTLHPQVSLYIFDGYFLPKKPEERTGFICKENLIKRYPI